MPADMCRTFDGPVSCFLFFKTTFVSNPLFHFTPLVFSRCYPQDFFPPLPKGDPACTAFTIPVCIDRLGEPDTVLETEGLVGEGSNRAYIDDVSNEIIVE